MIHERKFSLLKNISTIFDPSPKFLNSATELCFVNFSYIFIRLYKLSLCNQIP